MWWWSDGGLGAGRLRMRRRRPARRSAAQPTAPSGPVKVDCRRGMLAAMGSYVPQARDVAVSVDRAMFDGIRAMSPVERLRSASRASRALHRMSVAGLRVRFPEADDEELCRRAGALRLGRELTILAFGSQAEAWCE